jgi:precorrin-6B methylase 2
MIGFVGHVAIDFAPAAADREEHMPADPMVPYCEQLLLDLLNGYRATQLVYVMAKLQLADHIAAGLHDVTSLAAAARADPDCLRRVMRGLVVLGMLREVGSDRFSATRAGRLLSTKGARTLRDTVLRVCETQYPAWGRLLRTVRTGGRAFENTFGVAKYQYLRGHRRHGASYHRDMSRAARRAVAAMLCAYDFSSFQTIVDLGAGEGTLVMAALRRHRHLKAVLFDRPEIVARTRRRLSRIGQGRRCDCRGGNFLNSVPSGGDCYILRWTLHGFDNPDAIRILENCRRAMGPRGRVLVAQVLMPEHAAKAPAAVNMDLSLMMGSGGRERNRREYRELFFAAGLRLRRIVPVAQTGEVLLEGVANDRFAAGPAGRRAAIMPEKAGHRNSLAGRRARGGTAGH